MNDITKFIVGEKYSGCADASAARQFIFTCRKRHDDNTVDFLPDNSVPHEADTGGQRTCNPEQIPVYGPVEVRVENGKETATIKCGDKHITLHADRTARNDRAIKSRRVI